MKHFSVSLDHYLNINICACVILQSSGSWLSTWKCQQSQGLLHQDSCNLFYCFYTFSILYSIQYLKQNLCFFLYLHPTSAWFSDLLQLCSCFQNGERGDLALLIQLERSIFTSAYSPHAHIQIIGQEQYFFYFVMYISLEECPCFE